MNLNTAELERLIPDEGCGYNDEDDDSSSPTNKTISWPEHKFVKSTKVFKTGKSKGQTRHGVSMTSLKLLMKMIEVKMFIH